MYYLMSETNLYIFFFHILVVKGGSPTKGDKSKIVWEVVEQQFEALVSFSTESSDVVREITLALVYNNLFNQS